MMPLISHDLQQPASSSHMRTQNQVKDMSAIAKHNPFLQLCWFRVLMLQDCHEQT